MSEFQQLPPRLRYCKSTGFTDSTMPTELVPWCCLVTSESLKGGGCSRCWGWQVAPGDLGTVVILLASPKNDRGVRLGTENGGETLGFFLGGTSTFAQSGWAEHFVTRLPSLDRSFLGRGN